ncbi:hypothetical protein D3880_10175 [Pseudomonas cavernae]|uniref:Mor transcription activator domain-containing protein n=2 Tax=Pseudomonas cavernae TaxID=2320867 RepID=A0A385Z222_9PSED|nr:hypothetical protein D3880_10175 [Pseudomonas cavernae]
MVQNLASRMGIYGAFTIAKAMGGTSTYIPKGEICEAGKNLIEKIGSKQLVQGLIKYYGGEVLYIPSCSAVERALRNIEIHHAAEAGISAGRSMNKIVNDLATLYQLSDRHIWIILKRPPATSRHSPAGNANSLHAHLKTTPEIH